VKLDLLQPEGNRPPVPAAYCRAPNGASWCCIPPATARTTTEQQIEQIDPVGLDFKVMTKVSDVVTSGPAGTEETRAIRARNPDGTFSVISVEEGKSDQPPGIELQSSPSNQPQ